MQIMWRHVDVEIWRRTREDVSTELLKAWKGTRENVSTELSKAWRETHKDVFYEDF